MAKSCNHCGEPFQTLQPSALFCSRKCKTDAANLEAARGKQLYRLAYHWALAGLDKSSGTANGGKMGKAFSDLSWLARQFVREDKELGRVPPPPGPTDMTVSQSYLTRRAPKVARERRLREQA